jgi:magnesium transporter
MASDLAEAYLSNVSHRTNEIMKVLTLMASIFIPLTFVAGIYGMNFEYMPELQKHYGYFLVWAVMLTLAVGMVVFFYRRGWIGNAPPPDLGDGDEP